jgi:hypothetical protein
MSIFTPITDAIGLSNSTGDADAEAKRLREQAGKIFNNVKLPDLQNITPEQYKWLQDYKPELLGEIEKTSYSNIDSEFENLSSDPRLKDAQMSALRSMQDVANNGGMNAEDRANLARVQSESAQADRGRRDAILQNMGARGMGGSGMELLAQLQSSQAATDRQAQQGLDITGMAQRRALEAMMQQGNMAGNIRGQDFGEQSTVAQAQDAIKKFNASNSLQNNQFNAGRTDNIAMSNNNTVNQAGMYNNQGVQGVADKNTGATNQAQVANNEVKQQGFTNDMSVKGAQAQGKTNIAAGIDQQTKRDSDKDAAMFGAVANAGAAVATKSDERCKKEIKDIDNQDIADFLAAVKPKSFKYKGSEEPKKGFIMQDVLGTKVGQDIARQDQDGTFGFDQQSLNGVMLAAIKALAEGKK